MFDLYNVMYLRYAFTEYFKFFFSFFQQTKTLSLWSGYIWLTIILFWFAGMSAAFFAFPTQRLVEAAVDSGRLDPNFDRWDECKRAPLKVIVAAASGMVG